MAFELPITVCEAVDRINDRRYVLPAIQREFVWKPEQITKLFDSLLKGYPIGSFLFWTVKAENTHNYDFYHFVQHYHERDLRHNPKADLSRAGEVTAVLDGQQRLTALYIGLRGTYAYRKARARKTNDQAYPTRRLYLNLTGRSQDPELDYDLEFRADTKDLVIDADGDAWFRVGGILGMPEPWDAIAYLGENGLGDNVNAQHAMKALHSGVHGAKAVSFYLERVQELDRVLSIFVRVNSGGTVLSYSDLLLSMATAEWEDLDARETIYGLVDDINRVGRGFSFTKDFVLKTCLLVADLETRFSTTSFTSRNMRLIEQRWGAIEAAIRTTVDLVAGFGFSREMLPSANAVVPIVYYVAQRGNPPGFTTASGYKEDRARIRRWFNIALLKRTFSGQPDSILRTVREAIKSYGHDSFPAEEIVEALSSGPRSMRVEEADLDRLLDESYGTGYAHATLALLYPSLDLRNLFHQDHIHPQTQFTPKRLERVGVADPQLKDEFLDRRDRIANLQLLPGPTNQEKSGKPFDLWLNQEFASDPTRKSEFLRLHYIPDVDCSFPNFIQFYEARRNLLSAKLREVVGLSPRVQNGEA